jgi:hypothetical protein
MPGVCHAIPALYQSTQAGVFKNAAKAAERQESGSCDAEVFQQWLFEQVPPGERKGAVDPVRA